MDWKNDFAREWIIGSANDVEFVDIAEALFDEDVDDPDNEIAGHISDLIRSAKVEVTWE